MRTSAGWSEVATTTTECASASPRSRSMNSRTSRPRSPTRAITFTSAVVERAIIPSSEDLPTPEPAKMPSRWPRPHGTSVSSARTPSPTRSRIRGREKASGGAASVDRQALVAAQGSGHDLTRGLQLGGDRGVDLAFGGADYRAAALDAPIGVHLEVLDAAELRLQLLDRRGQQLEIARVDRDGHAVAVGETPK